MDSTMQTPLIWAQSILSHYLSPSPHTHILPKREPPAEPLHCGAFQPEPLWQCCYRASRASSAFPPLWRWGCGGRKGMRASRALAQSAWTVLSPCTVACKHCLGAHFSLRTGTKNYSCAPGKIKGALCSAGEQGGMQTSEPQDGTVLLGQHNLVKHPQYDPSAFTQSRWAALLLQASELPWPSHQWPTPSDLSPYHHTL